MYNKLHKSFDGLLSDFNSLERLAGSANSPFRLDDFTEAAIVAGKLEFIADILAEEWQDYSRKNDAADAMQIVHDLYFDII